MTEIDEDFEARLARVLTVGTEHLPVGRVVPVFDESRSVGRRHRQGHRRISRKVAVLAATATLAVTGTAAAVTIAHLTSAPVTETDVARLLQHRQPRRGRQLCWSVHGCSRPDRVVRSSHERSRCMHDVLGGWLSHARINAGRRYSSTAGDTEHESPSPVSRRLCSPWWHRRGVPWRQDDLSDPRPARGRGILT